MKVLLTVVMLAALFRSVGCGNAKEAQKKSAFKSPAVTANWQIAYTNPSNCTSPDYFAIRSTNGEFYVACRSGVFLKSTDKGASWSDITGNITFGTNGIPWTVQISLGNGDVVASTGGNPVGYWHSSADGGVWSKIAPACTGTPPNQVCYHNAGGGADSGCALPIAGATDGMCAGYFGSVGTSAMVTLDSWNSTVLPTYVGGTTSSVLGLGTNPVDGSKFMGTETQGLFKLPAGSTVLTNVLGTCPSPCSGKYGDIYWITFDTSGNPVFSSNGGAWKCTGSGTSYSCAKVLNTNQGRGMFTDSLGSIYYGHLATSQWPSSMYRSTDGGLSFKTFDTGLPTQLAANSMAEYGGMVYALMVSASSPWTATVYETAISSGGAPPNAPTGLGATAQ